MYTGFRVDFYTDSRVVEQPILSSIVFSLRENQKDAWIGKKRRKKISIASSQLLHVPKTFRR